MYQPIPRENVLTRQGIADTIPLIMPGLEPLDESSQLEAVRDFTQKNGLRAKVCNKSVAVPMGAFVGVMSRTELNAALGVHKEGAIRPQIIYDNALVVVH